jgi:hypothetical protein
MKTIHTTTLSLSLAAALCLAMAVPASAQTAAPAVKVPVKAKLAAKAPAKKPAATANRTNPKSATKSAATGVDAAEQALTQDELAIAERVHVGSLPCELGASVSLSPDSKTPGYFDVQGKNFKYRMSPVATTTGAIRLEDRKAGAVWLQLANKSMLMNQKQGVRLADECMSPAQVAIAETMKTNPPASVLDAPKPAAAGK